MVVAMLRFAWCLVFRAGEQIQRGQGLLMNFCIMRCTGLG